MDYTIAYCIPATRNKTQNTALKFMTSAILCQKLGYFSQINQFTRESPVNCVNFQTGFDHCSLCTHRWHPVSSLFCPTAGCPEPVVPGLCPLLLFSVGTFYAPRRKTCITMLSFLLLCISQFEQGQSAPHRVRAGNLKSSAPAGIPVDAELICFDCVQMLNLSYSGSLIGVNLARSSFSPPVGSTGSRL